MNLKNSLIFFLAKNIILKNKKFKDLHMGESCYLFGNAKSLKYYDLSLFSDRVSIGCNSLFLHKDFGHIDCQYYYNGDPFYLYPYWRNQYTRKIEKNVLGALYKKKIREYSNINFFINISDYPAIRGENIHYVHNYGHHFTNYTDCSLDGIFSANQSGLSSMLGMAIYLGFKDITLVGFDSLLIPKASEHFYEYGELDLDHEATELHKEYVKNAQEFLELRVVSPNDSYKGHIIPHIQYDELTGEDLKFKENHEIISNDDLNVLRNCNYNFSITENLFKKNNA